MITIFENRRVLKKYLILLRPIFDTTYKRKKRQNIHVSSTSRIGPIPTDNETKGDILGWTTS